MYTIEQLLCEIEACTHKLKILNDEKGFRVMPYEFGRLNAFVMITNELVESKFCESSEPGTLGDGKV